MITDTRSAAQVQNRRVAAGRRGYAKAVRRFLRREYAEHYHGERNRLAVHWASSAPGGR